jgi:hypothetical protein
MKIIGEPALGQPGRNRTHAGMPAITAGIVDIGLDDAIIPRSIHFEDVDLSGLRPWRVAAILIDIGP